MEWTSPIGVAAVIASVGVFILCSGLGSTGSAGRARSARSARPSAAAGRLGRRLPPWQATARNPWTTLNGRDVGPGSSPSGATSAPITSATAIAGAGCCPDW